MRLLRCRELLKAADELIPNLHRYLPHDLLGNHIAIELPECTRRTSEVTISAVQLQICSHASLPLH